MSCPSLPPAIASKPRRYGRPRVSDDPAERERHIECATLFFATGWPVAKIARTCDVSPATVYLWVPKALTYKDHPEYEALKRLALASRRRIQMLDELNQKDGFDIEE